MSKMLLPTELDTAMSPCPFLATARLDSASGMLVPPARSVSPMIVSGILAVSPRTVHIQTMTYERAPIMEMHRKKGDGVPLGAFFAGAIGNEEVHEQGQRHADEPQDLPKHRLWNLPWVEWPVIVVIIIVIAAAAVAVAVAVAAVARVRVLHHLL